MTQSTLGWVDLSPAALRRLRKDLEEKPEGVVDEMGVLAIHTGYADRFFPGTSVLQKRPRYLFFTCWNYLCLHRMEGGTATVRKEASEEWVKDRLKHANDEPIIGIRGERPAQPVDFIYWTALRKWGFYNGPPRSRLLNRWDSMVVRRVREGAEGADDLVPEEIDAAFFVPEPPHFWLQRRPRHAVNFSLTREEALFLQTRLQSISGGCLLSSAASLADEMAPSAGALWDDPLIKKAAESRGEIGLIRRSQQASSLGFIIRATYAALVETMRNRTCTPAELAQIKNDSHYQNALMHLLTERSEHVRNVGALDLKLLNADIVQLPQAILRLASHVKQRVERIARHGDIALLLDDETLELFTEQEKARKQERARLPDTIYGADRRLGFSEETLNVFPIDYRWDVVKALLQDLHDGLRRGAA